LVYGLTYGTEHGWVTPATLGLLASSAVLVAGFVAIEARSKAPLLPLGIFRLRTLSGSNVACVLMSAALFSQFFLLTLYMQEVLHYSAIKTGLAYIAVAGTSVVVSPPAQALVSRVGVRRVLPVGLFISAVAIVLYARLPVDGQYFWDIFPAFMLTGIGFALAFVSVSIGGLTGVRQREAGIASGLINTSQQVGGAIGLAVAATVATTVTNTYVHQHLGSTILTGSALTHGFEIAFYVLAGVAALGAVLAAATIESPSRAPQPEPADVEPVPAEAA
jgi:MFS family permease